MGKETKKSKRLTYNKRIIDELIEKYGLSRYYIQQCVAGRREGIVPDKLKKEYNIMDAASRKAIKSKIHQL